MRIILASESASRRRAMDLLGICYETCPAAIDEKALRDPDPAALTTKLAEAKAWKVAENFPEAIIVAGDAVFAMDGKVYEKPRDLEEAFEFLRELSGNEVSFVTSLVALRTDTRRMLSTVETSQIRFRALSDREIHDYIARYPVTRFAGAFDGDGVLRFAESVSGSFNFITALPVSRLAIFLREQGADI